KFTAAFEQCPRCIQVHAHADIEFGLGLSADDGGEMEDRIGIFRHRAPDECVVGKIAGDYGHARVDYRRRRHVDQHHPSDIARLTARVGEPATLEYGAREPASEKTGTTRNDDTHRKFPLGGPRFWT